MIRRCYTGAVPVILLACATLSCGPGTQAPKQPNQARAILDSVLKRYRALRSYQAQIELQLSGRMQKLQSIMFAFERPNKVAFVNKDPVAGVQIVSDGEDLYVYLEILKEYSKIPVPATFTQATQESLLSKIRSTVPALIMLENPDAYLMDNIKSIELQPSDSVGSHLCEVLRLTQNNNTIMQLWVDKRAHIIRKSTIDMTPYLQTIAEQQGITPPSTPVVISEWHKNIHLNEAIPSQIFTFEPPAGAQEVAQLSLGPQTTSSPTILVGQKAPAFTLEDLEGNTHNLQSLSGKVAIMSFWTTQNPQSVNTLTILQKLHERYAASGLVILGVTNEANVKTVKGFLEKRSITFPVLRDIKEAVAMQYNVRVLPRLIIIDQTGKIQTDLNRVPMEEELMSALKQLGIS